VRNCVCCLEEKFLVFFQHFLDNFFVWTLAKIYAVTGKIQYDNN
jgi:hypothetical protein